MNHHNRKFATLSFSTIAILALTLTGCAPSTEEVCKHVATFDTKMGDTACQFKFNMMKDTKPATYRKVAPCVMKATDADGFNACLPDSSK